MEVLHSFVHVLFPLMSENALYGLEMYGLPSPSDVLEYEDADAVNTTPLMVTVGADIPRGIPVVEGKK